MFWFVYIAQARTGRYYVGITTDPKDRIKAHNSGLGARMARQAGPFELKYVSKPFKDKSEARKREMIIKPWNRQKKEKLIRGEWQ